MAPSERTLAATAAFTGMAMFALMSDIAARSGSCSPTSPSSSSRVMLLYSSGIGYLLLSSVPLRRRWRRVDRVPSRHVRRRLPVPDDGLIRRQREDGHHLAVRKGLAFLGGAPLFRQLLFLLLVGLFSHDQLLWSMSAVCVALAIAAELSDSAFSAT